MSSSINFHGKQHTPSPPQHLVHSQTPNPLPRPGLTKGFLLWCSCEARWYIRMALGQSDLAMYKLPMLIRTSGSVMKPPARVVAS